MQPQSAGEQGGEAADFWMLTQGGWSHGPLPLPTAEVASAFGGSEGHRRARGARDGASRALNISGDMLALTTGWSGSSAIIPSKSRTPTTAPNSSTACRVRSSR